LLAATRGRRATSLVGVAFDGPVAFSRFTLTHLSCMVSSPLCSTPWSSSPVRTLRYPGWPLAGIVGERRVSGKVPTRNNCRSAGRASGGGRRRSSAPSEAHGVPSLGCSGPVRCRATCLLRVSSATVGHGGLVSRNAVHNRGAGPTIVAQGIVDTTDMESRRGVCSSSGPTSNCPTSHQNRPQWRTVIP
jgi:hypothetical protein